MTYCCTPMTNETQKVDTMIPPLFVNLLALVICEVNPITNSAISSEREVDARILVGESTIVENGVVDSLKIAVHDCSCWCCLYFIEFVSISS